MILVVESQEPETATTGGEIVAADEPYIAYYGYEEQPICSEASQEVHPIY